MQMTRISQVPYCILWGIAHILYKVDIQERVASVAFENTRTVLGITNGPVRSAIKGALVSKGFRCLVDAVSMVALHEIIEQDGADLIITTSKLAYDDATMLIREMRHNRLGNNPFIAVIMLLESPDKDELIRVVNAGVDDVLLMPISPSQLFARIEAIKKTRKSFVFTHDYVGPDRRKDERPGTAPALTYEPPNPMKLRDDAMIDENRYAVQVRNGLQVYRRIMMAVQSRQLEWLAGQVAVGCRDSNIPVKETAANAARLVNIGQDLGKRLSGDEYKDHLSLVMSMVLLARQISSDPRASALDTLSKMVDAAKDLKQRLAPPSPGTANAGSKAWN